MATTLAKRVEKLELEMQELKQQLQDRLAAQKPGPNEWKKSIGIFKDDPTLDQALRLGRAWRRRQQKC